MFDGFFKKVFWAGRLLLSKNQLIFIRFYARTQIMDEKEGVFWGLSEKVTLFGTLTCLIYFKYKGCHWNE